MPARPLLRHHGATPTVDCRGALLSKEAVSAVQERDSLYGHQQLGGQVGANYGNPQIIYRTVGTITLQVKCKTRCELEDFPLPAPNPFSESFATLGAVDRNLAETTLM